MGEYLVVWGQFIEKTNISPTKLFWHPCQKPIDFKYKGLFQEPIFHRYIYIYIPPKTESHYNGYMYVYVGVGGRFLVSITLCFSYLVLFFFNIGHFRQYGSYSGFLLTYFPNISLCYILAIWSVTWLTILLKFIFFNNVKYLMPVLWGCILRLTWNHLLLRED